MQGVEFVNDLRCNYLTIPYEGEENAFALRMIMENVTEGFLPVVLRRLDGKTYLYYNISGMQNMEIIYAEKTIDREAFQTFMWNLHDAIEQSRELFLPGDGICLEPSAIFRNLDTQRWEFLYVPEDGGEGKADMQREREELAEFLVMRIDYEDKELTDMAYRFYEEICEGRVYPDFFPEKEKGKERIEEAERKGEVEGVVADDQETEEPEWIMQENGLRMEKVQKEKSPGRVLFILWCTAFAVTFLLGRRMREVLIPGGAAFFLLTVLLLLAWRKQKTLRQETTEGSDMRYEEKEDIYLDAEEESVEEIKETAEEKTVFTDICREQERKLYGIGRFRREKIFLSALPCTIGKDKTLADHIISDASVSRMHARFFVEEENFWMQDLNSTNGTYHNGLRLRPNEKVMLEPEDEIGFGRVQFVYR